MAGGAMVVAGGLAWHGIGPARNESASGAQIVVISVNREQSGGAASVTTAPGADLFARNCVSCHGTAGKGDGPAAWVLYPKPRDFTSGIFRFKSTPDAQYPTMDDLTRIISNGIPRTAMPGFQGVLTDQQIGDLGTYVMTLAPARNGADDVRQPIVIPKQPEFTPHLTEQGRKVYAAMGCALCHGETGKGDGGASWSLKDDSGWPLPPADFTLGIYKAGARPEDLYRTIMIGVPGTPMPNFRGAIASGVKVDGLDPDVDMVWALTAYLKSLCAGKPEPGSAAGVEIPVEHLEDAAMLTDPTHSGWKAIVPQRLAVSPLWQRKGFASAVEVRAAAAEGMLAIKMSWPDATANFASGGVDQFADAGGMMFSLTAEIPPLAMGALNAVANGDQAAFLVNLWQWKADRQINADEGRIHDGPDAGRTLPDLYPYKTGDLSKGPLTEHDPAFISAWQAGNPKSDPAMLVHPVLEANAQGIGTLTWQESQDQNVKGVGRYIDGWWHVVFVRSLQPASSLDVDIVSLTRIPVAFAVWDGAAGDRNGTKLISGWHFLSVSAKDGKQSTR